MDINFLLNPHMEEEVRDFFGDSLLNSWLHSIHEGSSLMFIFFFLYGYF